jgi:hypothetical protein
VILIRLLVAVLGMPDWGCTACGRNPVKVYSAADYNRYVRFGTFLITVLRRDQAIAPMATRGRYSALSDSICSPKSRNYFDGV